jgi:ribosomal-protein-alanine N-acetyltransferase
VGANFSLTNGDVTLRIVRMRDAKTLEALVLGNRDWLRPWEATNPEAPQSFDFKAMVRSLLRQYDQQTGVPFVIEVDGQIVGQLNVANILYGAVSSAVIGYWVVPELDGQTISGRGVAPTGVALASDYLMKILRLHRVEIDIIPQNSKSLRVVEKLGFRYEGLKQRYIHINGAWRDHYVFALTAEDLAGEPASSGGVLTRWNNGRVPLLDYPWRDQK